MSTEYINELIDDYTLKARASAPAHELRMFMDSILMERYRELDNEKDNAVLDIMNTLGWSPKEELIKNIQEHVHTLPTSLDNNDKFTIEMSLELDPPPLMQVAIDKYNARKQLARAMVKAFLKSSPESEAIKEIEATSLFPENDINSCIHRTFQFYLHKELEDLLKQYPDSIYLKRIKQNDLVKVQSIETQYQGMGESDVIIGLLCPIKRTTVNRSIHDVEFYEEEGNRNLYFTIK